MSREYMRMWTVLMHTYYPPKDFTDMCDVPARASPYAKVRTVPCDDVCLTIVEIVEEGGTRRGCRH